MLNENIQFHSVSLGSRADKRSQQQLRSTLMGTEDSTHEIPALPELVAATTSLANGTRHKVLLPLGGSPREFALRRQNNSVIIDLYGTGSVPEVLIRRREVSLRQLLKLCADVGEELAQHAANETTRQAMRRVAQRASRTLLRSDPHKDLQATTVAGGVTDDPGSHVPLAFGFDISVLPSVDTMHNAHSFADIHALLFEGDLWAYSRGKRISLLQGPIMLAAQRMVTAVRALVEAWQADRQVNVRLKSENFIIGVRLTKNESVVITLGAEGTGSLTLPALNVPNATLPILRLASDLIRSFISIDRIQSRNLRIAALRSEVRTLRRIINTRDRIDGFENSDPDRLRFSLSETETQEEEDSPLIKTKKGKLKFTERWSAEIDGLDASSTFLCGDRIVVATPKLTLALSRDRGEVLWSQPAIRASSFLMGTDLLRLLSNGELELCELKNGTVYARTRVTPRPGGPPQGLFAGGGSIPPMAILSEGRQSIVAIDMRTGEPRWRFKSRILSPFKIRRTGRLLLIACGEGSIDALDIASGEVVWRFSDRVRFCLAPTVVRDVVVACSGEPGGGAGALYCIDLFSGHLIGTQRLEKAPSAGPIAAGSIAVVPTGRLRNGILVGIDPVSDRPRWICPDPGICNGGAAMHVDGQLLVNSPSGSICALDVTNGTTNWQRTLSNSLTDDVPRQLEPILRHGALFVPSARVHALRPTDGTCITTSMECDLVPDYLRVDERGWFYVAEESGHLRAYAPVPHLSLVQ